MDVSLGEFNNELKIKCIGKTDLLNGVFYNDINISTMTVCFNINQQLDLKHLKENLPETLNVTYNPSSKKSKIPKKKGTDSLQEGK
jgi:hypothetical protein